jgi:hypothetical protein
MFRIIESSIVALAFDPSGTEIRNIDASGFGTVAAGDGTGLGPWTFSRK